MVRGFFSSWRDSLLRKDLILMDLLYFYYEPVFSPFCTYLLLVCGRRPVLMRLFCGCQELVDSYTSWPKTSCLTTVPGSPLSKTLESIRRWTVITYLVRWRELSHGDIYSFFGVYRSSDSPQLCVFSQVFFVFPYLHSFFGSQYRPLPFTVLYLLTLSLSYHLPLSDEFWRGPRRIIK